MNPISFPQLSPNILSKIYDNLDESSKIQFGQTCYVFKRHRAADKYFQNITEFILAHYQIVASNVEPSHLKSLFFSKTYLIALGETHIKDCHQFLNSTLINLIWTKHSKLLIEGLKTKWQMNKGQFSYMEEEIAKSADSWDAKEVSEEIFLTRKLINHFSMSVTLMQTLLKDFLEGSLFYDCIVLQLEAFEIYGVLDNEFFIKIKQIPELSQLAAEQKDFNYNKNLFNPIYKKIFEQFVISVSKKNNEHFENFKLAGEKRSLHMKESIDTALEFSNYVITVSGKKHLEHLIGLYSRHILPFSALLLEPKDSVSRQEIENSIKKKFHNIPTIKNSESTEIQSISTESNEDHALNNLMVRIYDILANHLPTEVLLNEFGEEFLHKLFLECNIDTANPDHINLWYQLGIILLNSARKKLEN